MKRLLGIIRRYYLFFTAFIGASAALGLDIAGLDTAAHWILIAIAGAELIPLLGGMVQDVRHGKYGIDILAATAIITSLLLKEYWAAIVIVLMLTGGKALEDYAEHRAERELHALLSQAPQKARVLRGRKEVEVKASEVRTGDKLVIRPGELVPVDAVILEGAASFDESSLTGESLPQAKEAGNDIVSGSVNLDGPVTAKALRPAEDSQYQQIIRLVRGARNSQAPFVRLADRYAIPFTIVSFVIAITAWVVSGESIRFLEVIVVATPCPLILAAPIAIISGMSRSTKQGIIVKTGSSLERLATARTFAFDKTGTLTKGELTIENITTHNPYRRADILGLAASLEQHSNHAQATAIVQKAQAEHIKLANVRSVREIAGKGVTGLYKSKEVIVGRQKFLEKYGISMPKGFQADIYHQTAAFVAIGDQLAGIITFADEIRPESNQTLITLRKLGIKNFLMITGDNERTAKTIAKTLGIKQVIAGALPGEKIRSLETIAERPVAFVGDGVNDAPVLTSSDVGIALGARGSAAASESADIVIMRDDLNHVAQSVRIAKRTFGIAKQSIFIGIGLSVVLMLVFSTGKFKPIYGAAIQEVVDIVVIFNALRAHSAGRKKSKL
ncbi:MAG TPA: heavy metal translocating P-type ATPase [Candidatus Saccharimonadales bacterium]|nr:heavy metal translocating P-type ATPase [Candidatus Saccharimonadales bacterium]